MNVEIPGHNWESLKTVDKGREQKFHLCIHLQVIDEDIDGFFMPVSLAKDKMMATNGDRDSEINTSILMEIETDNAIHKNSLTECAKSRSLGKLLDMWTNFISDCLEMRQ